MAGAAASILLQKARTGGNGPDRCIRCGRFCRAADEAIPYGSYDDVEQEVWVWCADCARKEYERAVSWPGTHGGFYVAPNWLLRAEKVRKETQQQLAELDEHGNARSCSPRRQSF